jgi:chromosome segregation ATPase
VKEVFLMSDVQKLEQQLEQVRTELHAENQRGALKDSNKVLELEERMAEIVQQLDVEMRLAENKQVHEQRIEESHQEIAYIMDTLQAGDNTMRDLTINETAYQILREAVQLTFMDRDEKYLGEIRKLKEENAILASAKENLQEKYDHLFENFAGVKSELNTVRSELEDVEMKRDAAANDLEEAKKEIARLNSHIDDLRTEIAVGAQGAIKVANHSGNLADLVKQYNASKPAIYDVEPVDMKRSRFRAKMAETGEIVEFGYLEKGKYREVTAEEAEVFRAEYEAKRNQESAAMDTGAGVELEPFQDEDETTVGGLAEEHTCLEVAGQEATLEDRVAALERAVFGEIKGAA